MEIPNGYKLLSEEKFGNKTIIAYVLTPDREEHIIKYILNRHKKSTINISMDMNEEMLIMDHLSSKKDDRLKFLVKYVDVNYDTLSFEMKRINGVDLEDLFIACDTNQKVYSIEDIILVSEKIINLIDFVHESGIAHRDIKLGNFMLTPDGDIYMIDFGLSCFISHSLIPDISSRSNYEIVGTIDYLSPEVLSRKLTCLDDWYKVDIFAFGVLIVEFLTQIYSICKTDLVNGNWKHDILSGFNKAEFTNIIGSCLNADPKLRPTAREVYKDIYELNRLECLSKSEQSGESGQSGQSGQ